VERSGGSIPELAGDYIHSVIVIIIIIIKLQKTVILGTAHVLRKVLMLKYNRFNTGTNDISLMNSNNRIAATLYSLGT